MMNLPPLVLPKLGRSAGNGNGNLCTLAWRISWTGAGELYSRSQELDMTELKSKLIPLVEPLVLQLCLDVPGFGKCPKQYTRDSYTDRITE